VCRQILSEHLLIALVAAHEPFPAQFIEVSPAAGTTSRNEDAASLRTRFEDFVLFRQRQQALPLFRCGTLLALMLVKLRSFHLR